MKKLLWACLLLGVGLLFAGCGNESAPADTAVSPTEQVAEATSEAEIAPTDTATSTSSAQAVPQPTNTLSPPTPISPTKPAPPPPAPPATAVPPEAPALIWLPYATGNFGEPVLMSEGGELAYQPLPVAVEIFFDYQSEAGWLAYGSKFWEATASQDSVTDLHIYNVVTGGELNWAGQVGRAALSAVNPITGRPDVAVAIHRGDRFDLLVLLDPDNIIPLAEDVDPFFSWSPDGNQIAYLKDGELFITSKAGGDSGNPPIASDIYQNSQWIGDAPLWLGDSGYLLVADAPFTIVAVDGSESFVPLAEDDSALVGQRPFTMLYSATYNQLIAESEGMFGSNVTVYQFGDGFATAVVIEQIEDAQLAGWYEVDQSVVVVSGGEATILPLTPQE